MSFTLLPGPSMRERTTLRLGGRALAEIVISDTEGLERLPETLRSLGGEPLALGRGSNLLAREGELPLVLVRMRQEPHPVELAREEREVVVRAPAGMSLPRLLHWLARRGLSGLEGLSGVPGNVGGAVAMNAGSFGSETGQCLHRVRILRQGSLEWVAREGFGTGYRSFFLHGVRDFYVITDAEFRLAAGDAGEVQARMKAHLETKRKSQPIKAWTAGCAFRNPAPDAPAGMLLDKAGLKGFALGGMIFSERHANFLENTGAGTSDAALELLELARQRVAERFGHELQLEVKLCPCTV